MPLYNTLYILLGLSAFSSFYLSDTTKKYLYFLLSSIIFLYVVLRYEVGVDWNYYQEMFDKSDWDYVFGNNKVEPLFVLFCILIKSLGGEYYCVSAILGGLTVLLYTKSIYDYSKIPLVSLLFFFIPFFMLGNQVRQGFSLAVLMYGLRYLKENQFQRFLPLIIVAVGFHYSAVVFSIMLFLINKDVTAKCRLFIFLVILLIGSLFYWVNIGDMFLVYDWGHIGYKLNAYSLDKPVYVLFQSTFYWRIFVTLIIAYLYHQSKFSLDYQNKKILQYYNIFFIGLLFFVLTFFIPTLSLRGSIYFKIFEIFILVEAIHYFYINNKVKLSIILLLISITYYSRQLYFHNQNPIMQKHLQYNSILNKSNEYNQNCE